MTPAELKLLAPYLSALPAAAVIILFGIYKRFLFPAGHVRELENQIKMKDEHIARLHERYAEQIKRLNERCQRWENIVIDDCLGVRREVESAP